MFASESEEPGPAGGDPSWVEQSWLSWQSELACMSPQDRFEAEYGLPATPEAMAARGVASGTSSEQVAVTIQDEYLQLDRMQRIADAHRIEALLRSYAASMEDLAIRYGREYGLRAGKGAAAFFSTVALQTGRSALHIAHLVDTAGIARDRLPKTWAVFLTGATTWQAVNLAVGQADGLESDRWAAYDEVAAGAVTTSHRLKDLLRRTRERLQDDTADRRARTTFERRAVYLDHGADGSATWSMTGPAADQVAWDTALTKAAIAAKLRGESRTVTQLRYDIARDLLVEGLQYPARAPIDDPDADADAADADGVDGAGQRRRRITVPGRKGVEVKLILTVPALAWLGHSTEQALLAGYGPVALDTARALAGESRSMVRVLTDPVTGIRLTMDRKVYTPPADLRRWLITRDEWCRFPGCRRPAASCDIDHLREWHDHGVTDADNLLSECRPHHGAKTVDLYQAEFDSGGWARWRNPWGEEFTDPPQNPMDPAPPGLLPADDPPPF